MTATTPWGQPQETRTIAEGITLFMTAGHGGMHLDRDRQRQFDRLFPDFATFAGGPWYEEDEDCAAVVLAFPEHFGPEHIKHAIVTAHHAAARERQNNRVRGWSQISEWIALHPNYATADAI